ncbi:hypothetical protein [Methanocalculus sp.]|nr:hypothetical protein [Methanocalculus sp.]MDG6250759.1 hypothetical protein [Methanocalculus sp.]
MTLLPPANPPALLRLKGCKDDRRYLILHRHLLSEIEGAAMEM